MYTGVLPQNGGSYGSGAFWEKETRLMVNE
jgi:hypothetical protein